jgi:hypothetical protein
MFGFHFSFASILGSLIFSGVGFVAFTYGKREGNFRTMFIGGLLMAYSYFITNTLWMYVIGSGLTAALFIGA